jgi:hypothetical protein
MEAQNFPQKYANGIDWTAGLDWNRINPLHSQPNDFHSMRKCDLIKTKTYIFIGHKTSVAGLFIVSLITPRPPSSAGNPNGVLV